MLKSAESIQPSLASTIVRFALMWPPERLVEVESLRHLVVLRPVRHINRTRGKGDFGNRVAERVAGLGKPGNVVHLVVADAESETVRTSQRLFPGVGQRINLGGHG